VEKEITKRAPIYGLWDISNNQNPVYREPHPGMPDHIKVGLCVSEFTFQGGSATVIVSLPKTESGDLYPNTSGQLLFGWRSQYEEYFTIGLGGHGGAYAMSRYDPTQGWAALALVGTVRNLIPAHPYNMSFRMQGQRISLEVDVFEFLLTTSQLSHHRGNWVSMLGEKGESNSKQHALARSV
jgi:hypothetical protein